MKSAVLFELEQNRKRLDYYTQLKERSGDDTPSAIQKWIEIYSERTRKLETKAKDLGETVDSSKLH